MFLFHTNIPLTIEKDEILTSFHFLIYRSAEDIPPDPISTTAMRCKEYVQIQHHSRTFLGQLTRHQHRKQYNIIHSEICYNQHSNHWNQHHAPTSYQHPAKRLT